MNTRTHMRAIVGRVSRVLGAALVALVLTGCHSWYAVPPDALRQLDGYRAENRDDRRAITDASGRNHNVSGKLPFYIEIFNDRGETVDFEAQYRAIDIRDDEFVGTTVGGRTHGFPLNRVREVEVERFSVGKTISIAALGAGLLIGLFVWGQLAAADAASGSSY